METSYIRTVKHEGLGPKAQLAMSSAIPWMKFISALGFAAILFLLAGAACLAVSDDAFAIVFVLLYVSAAIMLFLPSLYLFQYANSLAWYLVSEQMADLEKALQKQRSCFQSVGTMLIIFIGFELIGLVFRMGRYYP